MPFSIVGWTGPGMRQVVRFGDRSTGRGTFRGELGRAIVTNGDFYGVRVRQCLNWRSCSLGWCVRWAETLLYKMGVHVVQREGDVLRVFVPFSMKCHCVADGEMFPLRMRKLPHFRSANVSLESLIRGLLAIYSVSA